MHGGNEDLDELLAKLNRYREEEGTADKDFQIHVISIDAYTADGIKRLEDKGVTDVIVGFRIPYINGPDTEPLDAKIRNLERCSPSTSSRRSDPLRRHTLRCYGDGISRRLPSQHRRPGRVLGTGRRGGHLDPGTATRAGGQPPAVLPVVPGRRAEHLRQRA